MHAITLALLFTPPMAASAQDPLATSLPRREGEVIVAGLADTVEIAHDGLGVPVIRGESFMDIVRGQGFVHAQERFFQMDLARRYAAGELAALVGPALVESDRRMRSRRLRLVAARILQRASDDEKNLLGAYVAGVNAGLNDLGAPPIEYSFLRATPKPWTAADSVLVILSLTDALHFNGAFEEALGVMAEALPAELVSFLTPSTTRFDSPLLTRSGEVGRNDYSPQPIPGPDVVNLRAPAGIAAASAWPPDLSRIVGDSFDFYSLAGSNNWAVAGSRSAHGGAMLANDPHLVLSVPGIWFRVELVTPDLHLTGVSLPGLPSIVAGSNGRLAWGLTNTTADFQDLIVIEISPDDPSLYRTPDGYEPFEEIEDEIAVAGGEPIRITLLKTRWGIVDRFDHHGRPVVLKWIGLEPEMFNLTLFEMRRAQTLEDGVRMMRSWHGPSQNVLLASDDGRIAWVVSGYLPKRRGFSGKFPVSWADGDVRWDGALDERDRPSMIDPPGGVLYTANNRTIERDDADRLANFWAPGVRAARIAEMLGGRDQLTEHDLFTMQLDTRVVLFDFHRDLAIKVIDESGDEALAEVRAILAGWNGRADTDQQALSVLERFRRTLRQFVFAPLVAPCRALSPGFTYRWLMDEEPLRRLLEERLMHMLSPRYAGWNDLVLDALRTSVRSLRAGFDGAIPPWGEINRARIEHPAASAAGPLARLLKMPRDPLPGHFYAVRVATPTFGASMRMVVSPGREDQGILHIPAGQSGHPLSPYFRNSHQSWLLGEPTPLRAGDLVSVFRLTPAKTGADPPG